MPTDVLPLAHAAATLGMTPEDLLLEFTRAGDTLFVSREAVMRFFERRLEPAVPVAQPKATQKATAPMAQPGADKKAEARVVHGTELGGADCIPLSDIPEFCALSYERKKTMRSMGVALFIRYVPPGASKRRLAVKRADLPRVIAMVQEQAQRRAVADNTEGLVELSQLPGWPPRDRAALNRAMIRARIKTVRRRASTSRYMATWASAADAERISEHIQRTKYLNADWVRTS